MCVCVCVLFGPFKPELGVIPSGQENHSKAQHLNFSGRELNVIDFTEQYFFKDKTKDRLSKDYKFISILFCISDVKQKHEEKYNRTSSDLMNILFYFIHKIFLRVFGLHQKHKTRWK